MSEADFDAMLDALADRMPPRALSWDYRQQPDLDQLARAVLDLSGGRVHLHRVDTGCDEYGIVLADREMTAAAAHAVWMRQRFGEDDD